MMRNIFNIYKTNKKPFNKSHLIFLALALAPIWLQGVDPKNLIFNTDSTQALVLPITAQAIVNDKAIQLEVSKTLLTHKTGLSHRKQIPKNRGMLYQVDLFNPLIFSGKGMQFPTDLIFIKDGIVIDTLSGVIPCDLDKCPTYATLQQYDAAIEVNRGTIEQLQIQHGAKVNLTFAKIR